VHRPGEEGRVRIKVYGDTQDRHLPVTKLVIEAMEGRRGTATDQAAGKGRLLAVAPWGQPSLKAGGALPAAASGQQTHDPDMLVEIRPFDGVSVADQTPITALRFVCPGQTRIPFEGDRQGSTIHEPHRQALSGKGHIRGQWLVFKRQSTHAMPQSEHFDAPWPASESRLLHDRRIEILGKYNWFQPKIGDLPITFQVDVDGFTTIRTEKHKTVRTEPENGWHQLSNSHKPLHLILHTPQLPARTLSINGRRLKIHHAAPADTPLRCMDLFTLLRQQRL
jgi:hypothetical protein